MHGGPGVKWDSGRRRLGSQCNRRAGTRAVIGAEADEPGARELPERGCHDGGVGGVKAEFNRATAAWPLGPSFLHPPPKTLAIVPPPVPFSVETL